MNIQTPYKIAIFDDGNVLISFEVSPKVHEAIVEHLEDLELMEIAKERYYDKTGVVKVNLNEL